MTTIRDDLDIAITGMSGRFPGADNIYEFWHKIVTGKECISTFSVEELLGAGHDLEKIKDYNFVPVNGYLSKADHFDANFFGFSGIEAQLLDPQIRLMLECVWHALENAGFDPNTRGRNIGLFLGARSTVQWTMQSMLSANADNLGGFLSSQLSNKDAMSTLISWKLGLEGPSFTLQTACSTSLVSIHLAAQSLLNGECDAAIAGGASLLLPQQNGHTYQDGMLFSKDGKTRAFDHDATGSVFGSGLGAVVLRRINDAIADKDPIWAVLRGSAVNNDGSRKVGYTAPSSKGQADVIRSALEVAEISAGELDYIECHGTATALGDSIEFMALNDVFADDTHQSLGRYALGSVKTSIGHLDSAAGVAGFIKTVLAIKHRIIPPTLHFYRPNSTLDFFSSPFYINTQAESWAPSEGKPRLAGVSSFGIGGTNAHAIVQEYKTPFEPSSEQHSHLFVFSAKTQSALKHLLAKVEEWLITATSFDLGALSSALGRRASLESRAAIVADNLLDLKSSLQQAQQQPKEYCSAQLEQSSLKQDYKDEIERWLVKENSTIPTLTEFSMSATPLHSVPGYCFEETTFDNHYFNDYLWKKMRHLLSGATETAIDKNAPGLLIPFWKQVGVSGDHAADNTQPSHSVALIDESLVDIENHLRCPHSNIEWFTLALTDNEQLNITLREITASYTTAPAPSLHITLLVPAQLISSNTNSQNVLVNLGRVLSIANFSQFSNVHLYFSIVERDHSYATKRPSKTLTIAGLKSLALVAPQEIPGTSASFLQIQNPHSSWCPEVLATIIRNKLSGPLKLNSDGLYIEDFRCPEPSDNLTLKHDDLSGKTFVVTGATGRMGRTITQLLASEFNARLALITRPGKTTDITNNIKQQLLSAGAKAVVIYEDTLHDTSTALTTFKHIQNELGEIHSVIHTAGVTGGNSFSALEHIELAYYQEQLDAKVTTTLVLDTVFEHITPKQCFLTSSMSCFFGGIAHAPYAMANLFQDEWVNINRLTSKSKWISINWETIHFDSSVAGPESPWGANEIAISDKDFAMFFKTSLVEYTGVDRKIVSGGNFEERLYLWGGRSRPSTSQAHEPKHRRQSTKRKIERRNLSSEYIPPSTQLHHDLIEIWKDILALEEIGIEDKFTELGGDSLKTVVMAEKVYKKIRKRISVPDFFKHPTVRQIEQQLNKEQRQAKPQAIAVIKYDASKPIIVNTDQELIFLHQSIYTDASYNMPVLLNCDGQLPISTIQKALFLLADRHIALRCLVIREENDIVLKPRSNSDVDIKVQKISGDEKLVRESLDQFAKTPFDLKTDLTFRVLIIDRTSVQKNHLVLVVVHHIVCDAVSFGVLADDFQQLLLEKDLPPLQFCYAAYLQSQASLNDMEAKHKAKAYWLGNILPLPESLCFPDTPEFCDLGERHNTGRAISRMIDEHIGQQVKSLCDRLKIQPSIFYMGVFSVLIAKLAHTHSLMLGAAITGRLKPELKHVVGYLVNILAFKIEPDDELVISDFLMELRDSWYESIPHQHFSTGDLVNYLSDEKYCRERKGRHRLFDVVYSYLPHSLSSLPYSSNGLPQSLNGNRDSNETSPIMLNTETASFDLMMEVSETSNSFELSLYYRKFMFTDQQVNGFMNGMLSISQEIYQDSEIIISDLKLD